MSIAAAPCPAPAEYQLPALEGPVKALMRRAKYVFLVGLSAPFIAFFVAIAARGESPLERLVAGASTLLFAGLIIGAFIAVPYVVIAAARLNRRVVKAWREHDYAWYRAAFPNAIASNGDAQCRHCGSEHVIVRNVMSRTFLRAHCCGRCGQTLYWSPEHI